MNRVWVFVFVLAFLLFSCRKAKLKTGSDLSKSDIDYIERLGLLENSEPIILFDSQGGFGGIEVSGNFFTPKRIASYWIDKRDSTKTSIDFSYYSDIDSITPMFFSSSLTYASYLEVHSKNNRKFKVFVDADSLQFHKFFTKAIAEWLRNKNASF